MDFTWVVSGTLRETNSQIDEVTSPQGQWLTMSNLPKMFGSWNTKQPSVAAHWLGSWLLLRAGRWVTRSLDFHVLITDSPTKFHWLSGTFQQKMCKTGCFQSYHKHLGQKSQLPGADELSSWESDLCCTRGVGKPTWQVWITWKLLGKKSSHEVATP